MFGILDNLLFCLLHLCAKPQSMSQLHLSLLPSQLGIGASGSIGSYGSV